MSNKKQTVDYSRVSPAIAKPVLASVSELNEAVSIIETLMQYGNIRPIEGVVYPAGTHKEFLEKAAEWLRRNRS